MIYCLDPSLETGAKALSDHSSYIENFFDAPAAQNKAGVLGAAQGFMTAVGTAISRKKAPIRKDHHWAKFDTDDSTQDATVTIVGHTDDTRETVGGKTPRELAMDLAKKYGNAKENLKEMFLFACEAGAKKGQLGHEMSESFAQELSDEMTLQGFNRGLIVYSVEPPEGAYSMRVSVVTPSALIGTMQGAGQVEAFAYMNKETEDYERAISDDPSNRLSLQIITKKC